MHANLSKFPQRIVVVNMRFKEKYFESVPCWNGFKIVKFIRICKSLRLSFEVQVRNREAKFMKTPK